MRNDACECDTTSLTSFSRRDIRTGCLQATKVTNRSLEVVPRTSSLTSPYQCSLRNAGKALDFKGYVKSCGITAVVLSVHEMGRIGPFWRYRGVVSPRFLDSAFRARSLAFKHVM